MKKVITLFLASSCFIFLFNPNITSAQAPVWNWAADAGGVANAHDKGQSCVTDASGNLYVTGYFYSPVIMFDSVTLNNTTVNFKADIFLAKYNSAGNLLWVKNAGGTDHDYSISCALDPNGNILIAGYYTSPILTVGGFQLTNSGFEDIFVAQFNSSGNVNWAKTFGGGATDAAFSIACDSIGTAFISGYFQSPDILFDNDTLHNTGAMDLLVVKLGIASGTVAWARSATGSDIDIAYSVAADASGNAYVGGYYSSTTLTFGPSSLSNQGGYDLFVVKYDGAGTMQWVNEAGGSSGDVSRCVSLDQFGNVYLTGYFGSPALAFGNTTLTASGADMFLASFDNSGNDRWATSAGAAYAEEGIGVCTDFSGNVYVTGIFESPAITIGNTILTNAASFIEDAFVAAYDNNGNNLWAKGAGGADVDISNAVCTDALANVFITGFYGSSSISFDGITLSNATAAPYQDVFVARLSTFTGIAQQENSNESFYLFPNPSRESITIKISDDELKSVEIFTTYGVRLISFENVHSNDPLDVHQLPPGIYFIRMNLNEEISTMKFIKE